MDADSPLATAPTGTIKFPAFQPDHRASTDEISRPLPLHNDTPELHGMPGSGRWQPRRTSSARWTNASAQPSGVRHGRQKSLSEAIRTIRTRQGSVSANAHEIADALKAPVSPKLILLCGVWYATSIMSNTSSKAILTAFPKPVTLTLIQFGFVSSWCLFLAWLARIFPAVRTALPVLKNGIRKPNKDLIMTTLPLTAFQIGGHILSSDATSRIPVSLVHTIKGLSPLFTVMAYKFVLGIDYPAAIYYSLIPLTAGVVMACSANFSGNLLGLLSAFGSAILFVTQNIVSKTLFNEAAAAEADGPSRNKKPDKLNLLCYSSGLAFLCTAPLWLFSEGFTIIADLLHDASLDLSDRPGTLDHGSLVLEYIFNGTFHFGQSLVAFVLLSMISPVTYSVASLFKRVFVICFAIIWFGNTVSSVQGFGILLTFLGLYLYDRTSDAAKADKKAEALQLKDRAPLLPTTNENFYENMANSPEYIDSPVAMDRYSNSNGFAHGPGPIQEEKRGDTPVSHRPRLSVDRGWLPPGTRQEDTWSPMDKKQNQTVPAS
ncbi:TPT-domain-containing protein [Aulographum hederae CBS 113979]|uniref:TPT-domain-containing protein n=1 Tax=Aulographum hederae CBS 113979 TaxID=1176131 RepID=A0A6G1HCF7_9PEZI|nr:TPT-domain-containing protein [Aulographum hederae CBS 113979]